MAILENLKRLQRRSLISTALQAGEVDSNTKQLIRQKENSTNLEETYNALISQEFYIDRETKLVARNLSRFLNRQFPDYEIAVILAGSAIHGGKQLRKIFLGTFTSDFDCILGINPKKKNVVVNQEVLNLIDAATESYLKDRKISLCKIMRPKNLALPPFTDPNNQQITLLNTNDEELIKSLNLELFYFYPSFPPEFNNKNRQNVLKLLKNIYQKSPYLWKITVTRLLRDWAVTHRIQYKYIKNEQGGNNKSTGLAIKIESESKFKMLKHFETLLLSTGDPMTIIDL